MGVIITPRNKQGYSDSGHHFALTRNCHGSGYWERTGEAWDKLLQNSQKMGSTEFFINDEGKLDFLQGDNK